MKTAKVVLLFAGLVTGAQRGESATIRLFQGGWDMGGPLIVHFTGDDANSNMGIDTAELTAFSAVFSLPGGGNAVFSLADLGSDGFFYGSETDYFFKADNPEYSLYDISAPGGPVALVSESLGTFIALSGDSLQQVPIPEPATASLLSVSLVAALLVARSRRCRRQREIHASISC
jgi:hypothetical protein